MKKIITWVVAFGVTIAPLNAFASTEQSEKRLFETIAVVVSVSALMALLIASSDTDSPVSP